VRGRWVRIVLVFGAYFQFTYPFFFWFQCGRGKRVTRGCKEYRVKERIHKDYYISYAFRDACPW
jgi:hypothetical protein